MPAFDPLRTLGSRLWGGFRSRLLRRFYSGVLHSLAYRFATAEVHRPALASSAEATAAGLAVELQLWASDNR